MKFKTEKILHEVIRDLPEAARIDKALTDGKCTIEEALEAIAYFIREEKERSKTK